MHLSKRPNETSNCSNENKVFVANLTHLNSPNQQFPVFGIDYMTARSSRSRFALRSAACGPILPSAGQH